MRTQVPISQRHLEMARQKALTNRPKSWRGHFFHVVALVFRGKSIVKVGTNSYKTSPKFRRHYAKAGKTDYHAHAEMSVLSALQPGDRLVVIRFLQNGEATMSKPCPVCQKLLQERGVQEVLHTDWDGTFTRMRL